MESTSRPRPGGLSPAGPALTTPEPRTDCGPDPEAPLARVRQSLPPAPAGAVDKPLQAHAIGVGRPGDTKSSHGVSGPTSVPAARMGLRQLADLGALAAQRARRHGESTAAPSNWSVALGVHAALPGLHRFGAGLFGKGFQFPPDRGDAQAMTRQAAASLALDPAAPLPLGDALVDRLLAMAVPPGPAHEAQADALADRLEGVERHLSALACLSEEPLDPRAPAARVLKRLDALDQAIHALLADASAGLPAALRAELTRLRERVAAERGFVQGAEAFARAHDTADLNLEGLTAYLRHGASAAQLHFVLFEQSVTAAYRASYVAGTPVAIPQSVADSYEALWAQVTQAGQPMVPAASTSLTSSPSKPSPPLAAPPPAQDVEPGYHGYNSNADLEE